MKKEDFLAVCRNSAKKPLTAEDETFFGVIGESLEKSWELEKVERSKAIEAELTKVVGTFDGGENVASVIRKLAESQDNMKANQERSLSVNDKYALRKKLNEKKDEILAARSAGKEWALEFRAVRAASAMMTTSTVLTGAQAVNTLNVQDDLELLVIQYPKNFIIDAVKGKQVAKVPATLQWKEQKAESTSALGLTAEGGEKKLTDKSFEWKYAHRVKYTGRIEFTEELTMDFDQLLLQIIDMFEQQVVRSWNAGVQTEIVAYCSEYTTTELDGKFIEPNIAQVIKAGKLWIANNLYEADTIMIRPGDAAMATMSQNKTGDITYLPDAIAFDGLTPFVSTNVPEGKIIIGMSSAIKEQHSSFIIRRGTINEQLITNEETIVGEVFSLLKTPTILKKSWVILDIATVKDALTKTV